MPETPVDDNPVPPAPRARWTFLRHVWHLGWWTLLVAPLLIVALVATLAHTALGTAWLLGSLDRFGALAQSWGIVTVPTVRVQGPRGALMAPDFAVERVEVRWDSGRQAVIVEGARWSQASWRWFPSAGVWARIDAPQALARRVEVQTGPRHLRDVPVVRSLAIPLAVLIEDVRADEVVIDALAPFQEVRGRAEMGTQADGAWRFSDVRTRWHEASLQGELTMGTVDGLRFDGRVQAQVPPRQVQARQGLLKVPAWSGQLTIGGRLDQMALRAEVKVTESPVHLRLEADLRPFRGWPLSTTRLDMGGIDLSVFKPGWPRTRLSGRADLTLLKPAQAEASSRLLAQVNIDNDLAGRWEQGRLPVRRVRAQIEEAAPDSPDLLIRELVLELAGSSPSTQAQPAEALRSRLTGDGSWSPRQGLSLRTQWQQVLLTDLWPQAPALRLNGKLDTLAQSVPSAAPATSTDKNNWSVTVLGSLNGSWLASAGGPAARAPVGIDLDMKIDPDRWQIDRLGLRSGATALQGQADIIGWSTDQWQIQTQGRLQSFDPRPWLGHERAQALSSAPTALSGDWALTARLPRPRSNEALDLNRTRALSGQGQFRLQDSQLLGQALEARLELTQSGAGDTLKTQAQGEARLGPNRLRWDGRLDAQGDGSRDQWQAVVEAPDLAAWRVLSPLLGPSPTLTTLSQQWPHQGRANLRMNAQGRWPHLRTQGEARLQGARGSRWEAGELQLQWQLDADDRSALSLQGLGTALRWDSLRLDNARLEGSGSWSDHRLTLMTDWPYAPSAEATALWGLERTGSLSTRAQVELRGGWNPGLQAPRPRWQGTLDKVWIGPASAPSASPSAAWVRSEGSRLSLQLDEQGQVDSLTASAGTARLAAGLVWEWDELRWAASPGAAAPAWSIQARIRPFELAPWLQRATPGVVWGGDLKVGASVQITAAEGLNAAVDIGRRSGSLTVNDGENTLDLGVSDLFVSARAQDGVWTVTPLFVGKTLGVITGAVSLKTEANRRWPAPQAGLEGALHATVPNLAIWRAWLPTGWRLSGELWSTVQLLGQWREPEVRGELQVDRLALRNPLQGVDVKDGRVRLQLQGTQAQLTELFIQGGDGDLRGTGQASLGSRPQAQVNLQARQFRVLGRLDRQLTASGQAKLNWSAAQLGIDGQIQIDNGLFDLTAADAPTLDRDVVVLRSPGEGSRDKASGSTRSGEGLAGTATQAANAALSLARPPATPTQMKLAVRLGERLRLKGRGMDTRLGGDIVLSSPQSRLNVSGSVQTLGGTYAAYGQKLSIERGLITFSGPVENPALDILALRPNLDTRVGVAITGTALAPRVRLFSDPDLPESDKLSWLVLGRGSSGLGRADSTVLQRAALALLAGEGEAPTDALLRTLGIDDLSLRQGDGDVKETVVSLGKQISRNWYLGYERSVNAASGTFQLIYRLGQNFTLRAQSGVENAVDLIWTWRFNGPASPSSRQGSP